MAFSAIESVPSFWIGTTPRGTLDPAGRFCGPRPGISAVEPPVTTRWLLVP